MAIENLPKIAPKPKYKVTKSGIFLENLLDQNCIQPRKIHIME